MIDISKIIPTFDQIKEWSKSIGEQYERAFIVNDKDNYLNISYINETGTTRTVSHEEHIEILKQRTNFGQALILMTEGFTMCIGQGKSYKVLKMSNQGTIIFLHEDKWIDIPQSWYNRLIWMDFKIVGMENEIV